MNGGFTIHTLCEVEMSGFEPESERLDPRISTSVADCQFSPEVPQPAREDLSPAAGARKPLFHVGSGVVRGTLTF